jgi:hypothetical protein
VQKKPAAQLLFQRMVLVAGRRMAARKEDLLAQAG